MEIRARPLAALGMTPKARLTDCPRSDQPTNRLLHRNEGPGVSCAGQADCMTREHVRGIVHSQVDPRHADKAGQDKERQACRMVCGRGRDQKGLVAPRLYAGDERIQDGRDPVDVVDRCIDGVGKAHALKVRGHCRDGATVLSQNRDWQVG
jgi:hypothetical protein